MIYNLVRNSLELFSLLLEDNIVLVAGFSHARQIRITSGNSLSLRLFYLYIYSNSLNLNTPIFKLTNELVISRKEN